MVPNKADAEDLLQEAFVAAFNNLKSHRGESSFGTWLRKIVVNRCLNFIKKKKIHYVDGENEEFEDKDDETIEAADIDPVVLHNAIKELPHGARIVFNLYIMENYKHYEIAEMLSISVSTSKTQYMRARTLLQHKLKSTINEELA
jgi:RNA polymerase sigma-70 factor (ECF subfamily)